MKKGLFVEIQTGLDQFLKDYPQMSIKPTMDTSLIIEGKFWFSAETKAKPQITDCYALRIEVPAQFPSAVPKVTERENKIPRTGDFHVNPDGTLCLGSPLRILLKLSKNPSLSGFASDCLVPYLYAISHKLKFGGALPFGELAHGRDGELQDYLDLFGLTRPGQVYGALRFLGMKKRRANKQPCPCDCGKRLGRCRFNRIMRDFRKLAGRPWFREQL